MKVTWYGTASVALTTDSGTILLDPFVPLKHSPAPITTSDFDGFTDILITHGHFDHIASLPEIVRRNPGVRIHCTATPYRTLLHKGIPETNLVQIHVGDCLEIQGFQVDVYAGLHAVLPTKSLSRLRSILTSPARDNLPGILKELPQCKENGETVLFRIECDNKTVCIMGRLNLRDDVDYPSGADLLLLPYNGWEDNYPPALRCIRRLAPKRILLDHFDDTFPPITSPLDLSPILAGAPVPMEVPDYGKAIEI